MKVYLSNYRDHWLSPYTILEKVIFWREIDYDEPMIAKWADRLEPFSLALQSFLNFVHPKIDYVKIDYYDSWNAHNTASKILYPLLKQLQATKHGSGFIDDEDVPEHLRSTAAEPLTEEDKDCGYPDNNLAARYEWVLNEVLFALKSDNEDWVTQFYSGVSDYKTRPCKWDENGKPTLYEMYDGPNHTQKVDWDGRNAYQKRIDNGFRLMGKYWQTFWD